MTNQQSMPVRIGEYLAATAGMCEESKLLFNRLLEYAWAHNGVVSISSTDLRLAAGATPEQWERHSAALTSALMSAPGIWGYSDDPGLDPSSVIGGSLYGDADIEFLVGVGNLELRT